jgi:predicted nucleic acid-binding Zn finger protein
MDQEENEGLFKKLKKKKALDSAILKDFSETFNDRFWKGLKAAVDGQVKKYVFHPSKREIWVIVGKKKDYLLISDFYCSCQDFYLNVVVRKKNKYCYHILSKTIAEALNLFEEIKIEDSKYDILMKEWEKIEDT